MQNSQKIQIHKLTESHSYIDADSKTLIKINDLLKVKDPNSMFDVMVKRHLKSPYIYYAFPQNGKLVIMNGHIPLIKMYYPNLELINNLKYENIKFKDKEIDDYLEKTLKLLPFVPYDYQEIAFKESLKNKKCINIMSTSCGKSVVISMIADFMRTKNKKGLLLVPNINLLNQFYSDIKDYNLIELYNDTRIIGGGETKRIFDKSLTISTWQSLMGYEHLVNELDYLICDEVQYFASEHTGSIVKSTKNTQFKIALSGTLPEDPTKKMQLLGLFGMPKTYITPRELINRGIACPIQIKVINLKYTTREIYTISGTKLYAHKVQFLKEHENRMKYCVQLMSKLSNTHENTLLLFGHTLHGKDLFINLMKLKFPNIEVNSKDITGKHSFEFQKKYNIFFLNGEDNAKKRELARLILEKCEGATLIANIKLLAAGVSINRLHNIIIASPIKTYSTVTQIIGRLMRLHKSKTVATIYDLVDQVSPFKNQFKHRKKTSYQREQHPITEISINLEAYFDEDQVW